MPDLIEISFPLGQGSLRIETEQDHNSNNVQALARAEDQDMKHAENVDHHCGGNLKRRLGFHDAFHDPYYDYDVSKIFTLGGAATLQVNYGYNDTAFYTYGIRGLARYTYFDNRITKNPFGYHQNRYTIFATRDQIWQVTQLTLAALVAAPALGATITQAVTGATGIVIAESLVNLTITVYDLGQGYGMQTLHTLLPMLRVGH